MKDAICLLIGIVVILAVAVFVTEKLNEEYNEQVKSIGRLQ